MILLQKHNPVTGERFDGLLELSDFSVGFKQVVIEDSALDGGDFVAVDTTYIEEVTGKFLKHLDFELDSANCFAGTLTGIGSDGELPAWTDGEGHTVVITAEADGCFNIENNATVDTTKFRAIDTRCDRDLSFIRKALFAYSVEAEKYVLLSFQKIKTWHKNFKIAAIRTPSDPYDIDIPAGVNGLPYNGYYHIDAFFGVQDIDEESGAPVPTVVGHVLRAKGNQEPAWLFDHVIDSSDAVTYAGVGGVVYYWSNTLQGSKIVRVNEPLCANRKINIRIEFNNGDLHDVEGYVDVHFLGSTYEGSYCCIDPI